MAVFNALLRFFAFQTDIISSLKFKFIVAIMKTVFHRVGVDSLHEDHQFDVSSFFFYINK